MKAIAILFLFLSLNSCVNAKCSDKVIAITQVTGGGNHTYYTFIGSDNRSINKVLQSKRTYANIYAIKYCMKSKVVEYITQYINQNCDSVNRITEKSTDFFIISVTGKNKKQVCCLENKSTSIPFFIGFKKWIERSPYKDYCEKFLESIEPYTHEQTR